jgi:hypothetical protein
MTMLATLKITAEERSTKNATTEDMLRAKLVERLGEQLELANAEATGKSVVKTRSIFVTNEEGERVTKDVERRLRKWFWRNADGIYFIELRYGGKALKLDGKNTAVEAGTVEGLAKVIATLTEAVKAGEMDKALVAAKKERATIMRRKR